MRGTWHQFENEDKKKLTASLDAWFRICSIIVKKSDFISVRNSIIKKNLVDIYNEIGIISTQRQGYFGEFPWHPSCRFMDDAVDSVNDNAENSVCSQSCDAIDGKYLVPVSKYEWERGEPDYSLDKPLSFYMPAAEIIKCMNLKRSLDTFGVWRDSQGVDIFADPSLEEKGPSFALVKKDAFLKLLDKNGLEILWLIGGEKQCLRTDCNSYKRLVYNALCYFDDGKIKTEMWFEEHG